MPIDEQPLRPREPEEEAFARALAPMMLVITRAIDGDLARGAGLQLSEYAALLRLSGTPEKLMRMGDLAAASGLSLSGMTSVLTRLERQGLAERVRSAEDGRSWNAVLTDAGLERLDRAWQTYLASVRRHLVVHMSGQDLARLTETLERVAADHTVRG